MNILLINPPTPNILRESLPPVVEDDSGIFPPLGLLYIASYVEDIKDCSVEVLDCQAEKFDHEKIIDLLKSKNPDVIGIQVMTFTLIDASIVAKNIRKTCPNAFTVFGGPHPTIFPNETIQIPEVDAVIAGEGEYTFAALVEALKNKNAPEDVTGVMTKKNRERPLFWEHINDLDILKMPARHLIKNEKYCSPLAKTNPVTTMMSSRGCPAKCIFCDRPQMGKQFRFRSAENVVKEMRYCSEELGIREFMFYDDTFTVSNQRVIDVCNMIMEQNITVSWDIRARIDTVTLEMITKLKKAGCHRIHYGVESGSPKIQKLLKKNLNLDKVREIFAFTKKEGIEVLGYFMIGCPDETKDDLDKTLELIQSLPMDYAHIGIFTPYPGTEIYRKALKDGIYETDYWKEFALNPSIEFTPRYWNQYFSDEELLSIMKRAYGSFYSRPSYIYQRVLKIRSMDEFLRKAGLGIKLLKSVYSKR